MTENNGTAARRHIPLIIALIFLANPNINVIDVLPDFIAYFIIARSLNYASDRSPYFAEAKADFYKLCVIGLAKIPALFIQTLVRSGNVGDNDIVALFAFTFGVVELIISVSAIKNLFSALFYLGERTDASPILSTFSLSKKKAKKKTSPEALRALTLTFVSLKCAAYSLPELLLLSKTVSVGQLATYFNVAKLYPYITVIAVPTLLVLGIVHAKRWYKYISAISVDGKFRTAVDSMVDENGRLELRKKDTLRNAKHALTVFIVASFFCIEMRFSNFNSVNILPRFVFALIIIYGLIRISAFSKSVKPSILVASLYAVSALVLSVLEVSFFDSYSYAVLPSSENAKAEFSKVVISSAIEFFLFSILMVFLAAVIKDFAKKHSGISQTSERYNSLDAEHKQIMTRKVVIWSVIGIVSAASRLLNVIFRYFSSNFIVEVEDGYYITSSTISESAVPWFGAAVFAITVLFIGYTFHLFTTLQDDAELKYQ